MIGKPSGLIDSLPKTLRNRLAYLGELQDQHDELAEKLHDEQLALQRKYEKLWGKSLVLFFLMHSDMQLDGCNWLNLLI